jgi:hypothetical protein
VAYIAYLLVKSYEIAPVGFERVAAGAAFRAHHVEKGFDGRRASQGTRFEPCFCHGFA